MYIFQLILKKNNHVEYSSVNPLSVLSNWFFFFCFFTFLSVKYAHSIVSWRWAVQLQAQGGEFKAHRRTMIEARAGHFLMSNCSWMPDLTRQQRLISTTATLSQFNKVLNIFEPSIHFLKPWTRWAILWLCAVSRGQAGTNLWGLKGWSRKYVLIWAPMSQLRTHRTNKSGSYTVFTQLSS